MQRIRSPDTDAEHKRRRIPSFPEPEEIIGANLIIAVGLENIGSAAGDRLAITAEDRRAVSRILLMNYVQARVLRRETVENGACRIPRAIVDDQQLPRNPIEHLQPALRNLR